MQNNLRTTTEHAVHKTHRQLPENVDACEANLPQTLRSGCYISPLYHQTIVDPEIVFPL